MKGIHESYHIIWGSAQTLNMGDAGRNDLYALGVCAPHQPLKTRCFYHRGNWPPDVFTCVWRFWRAPISLWPYGKIRIGRIGRRLSMAEEKRTTARNCWTRLGPNEMVQNLPTPWLEQSERRKRAIQSYGSRSGDKNDALSRHPKRVTQQLSGTTLSCTLFANMCFRFQAPHVFVEYQDL